MSIVSKESYENFIENSVNWLLSHGVNIVIILVIGFALYHLGKYLMSFFSKILVTGAKKDSWTKRDIKKRHETISSMLSAIWKIVVVVFVIVSVTHEIAPNVNFTTFIASLGAISVIISVGAQSLIKDFLNGIFIVSENQYRVGDVIDIDGNTGTVQYVGTRTTVLRDFEGNVHYFPNGTITHVVNKTMSYSMSNLKLMLSPNADLDKAIKLINSIGQDLAKKERWKDKIIEAPHFDSISSIDGSGIEIIVRSKTQPSEQWSVSSKMRQLIIREFDKNDISLS